MASFTIYLIIIFVSTFFVWCRDIAQHITSRYAWLFASFLVIFIPSALRYGVGTDFFNYYYLYENNESVNRTEYGFYALNEALHWLGASQQYAIAAYAFLFLIVSYASYPKQKAWIFHLLVVSSLLFFSFNGIRQAISLAFIMLAIKNEINGKWLIAFVLVAVSSLFHQSALFILPFFLFSKLPLGDRFKFYVFPISIIILTAFFLFAPSVVNIMRDIMLLLDLPYSHYFESSYFKEVRVNTGVVMLTKTLLIVVLTLGAKRLLEQAPNLWPLVVYGGFFAAFYSLTAQSAAFGRFSYILLPGMLYFLYFNIRFFTKKSYMSMFVLLLALASNVFPYFTTALSTVNDNYNDNYYRSIFDDN